VHQFLLTRMCALLVSYRSALSRAAAWASLPSAISRLPPDVPASIYWGPNSCPNHCYLGQPLSADIVSIPPLVCMWEARHDQMHTLLLIDADALALEEAEVSSESAAEVSSTSSHAVLRWHVSNIPACNVSAGRVSVPYAPPSHDTAGSGSHRYVFLVYRQSCATADITQPTEPLPVSKERFSLPQYLAHIGGSEWTLVAGNFFTVAAAP
jgi:phosphatidylethanolamine-binding protein (PEBP) family uncharacterized protein